MEIITAPNPILRQKCEPIRPEELPEIEELAKDMARIMYRADGCGLAAPQVGVAKQLIVLDTTLPEEGKERVQAPLFILNPRIIDHDEELILGGEGCLSIPGIAVEIERYATVTIEALDIDGEPIEIRAVGFDARALQHEMDHLEGITMFEHLDAITCATKLQEYAEAKAAGAKPGDTFVASREKDSSPAAADQESVVATFDDQNASDTALEDQDASLASADQ